MTSVVSSKADKGWRNRWYQVIFGTETTSGKAFDLLLIVCILLSVSVVMLDSLTSIHAEYKQVLYWLEWGFTLLFSLEYALRLTVVNRPGRYALSWFGVIDLLSILPTWLSLFLPGGQYLLVIRLLRVLRIFRVLKLAEYIGQSRLIMRALLESKAKILVFLFGVLIIVTVFGSLMYLIEGPENGFISIPHSIYWAIVTLTTVGYGDISPKTPLGQFLASIIMLVGYAIIAVPTGIVTASMVERRHARAQKPCPTCGGRGHAGDAVYCKHCGGELAEEGRGDRASNKD